MVLTLTAPYGIVTLTIAVLLAPPLVPVKVMLPEPAGAVFATATVIVAASPGVTLAGLMLTVTVKLRPRQRVRVVRQPDRVELINMVGNAAFPPCALRPSGKRQQARSDGTIVEQKRCEKSHGYLLGTQARR